MCAEEFSNLWCHFCGCVGAVLAQAWRYAGALWSNAGAQQSPSIAPDLRQHSANTATKTAPQVTEFLSSNMHKVYAVDIVYALGADFRTRVWTPKWPKPGF